MEKGPAAQPEHDDDQRNSSHDDDDDEAEPAAAYDDDIETQAEAGMVESEAVEDDDEVVNADGEEIHMHAEAAAEADAEEEIHQGEAEGGESETAAAEAEEEIHQQGEAEAGESETAAEEVQGETEGGESEVVGSEYNDDVIAADLAEIQMQAEEEDSESLVESESEEEEREIDPVIAFDAQEYAMQDYHVYLDNHLPKNRFPASMHARRGEKEDVLVAFVHGTFPYYRTMEPFAFPIDAYNEINKRITRTGSIVQQVLTKDGVLWTQMSTEAQPSRLLVRNNEKIICQGKYVLVLKTTSTREWPLGDDVMEEMEAQSRRDPWQQRRRQKGSHKRGGAKKGGAQSSGSGGGGDGGKPAGKVGR